MIVKFSANEQGMVDEVEIVRGVIQNMNINREVIRVIKKIHDWDVFFLRGKHIRFPWIYTLVLSEEIRAEYKNKMPNR
jgi:hypothetical protein